MKKLGLGTFGVISMVMAASPAHADDELSVSATIDYVTEYVFRGSSFARGAVQPGIEASISGFTAGLWYSEPTGDTADAAGSELDLYASYSFAATEKLGVSIGGTIYHYPDTDGGVFDFGDASTFELFTTVSWDTKLAPTVSIYYDVDLEALTFEGGLSHSVPIDDKFSFDIGGTIGTVIADNGGDYDYQMGSVGISYAVTDATSVYFAGNVAMSSADSLRFKITGNGDGFTNSDSMAYLSAGLSTGF